MSAKKTRFNVLSKMTLTVAIEIPASSLAEAYAASDKLTLDDFVDVHGDILDELEFEITGVYE